jgi:hypothetical protein
MAARSCGRELRLPLSTSTYSATSFYRPPFRYRETASRPLVLRELMAAALTLGTATSEIGIFGHRCLSQRPLRADSSLIPGLGVKLSNDRPCRAQCSLRGRGEPSA